MKEWRLILLVLGLWMGSTWSAWGDQTVTVTAKSDDISQNLDLKAVANVFGECKDLEEFEKKLNSDQDRISNLDLNGDGMVDYLRVIETGEGQKHLVVVQAVLAQDVYQDVATIQVEKDSEGKAVVQVIGDPYVYGANYIIEPVYLHVPYIYDYFWGPVHAYWVSPYYWGYWPGWYVPFGCWGCAVYCDWMYGWHHIHYCSYRYPVCCGGGYSQMYGSVRRNDCAVRNPSGSFSQRQTAGGGSTSGASVRNTRDLGSAVSGRGASSSSMASSSRGASVASSSRGAGAGAYSGMRAVQSSSSFASGRGSASSSAVRAAASTASVGRGSSVSTASRGSSVSSSSRVSSVSSSSRVSSVSSSSSVRNYSPSSSVSTRSSNMSSYSGVSRGGSSFSGGVRSSSVGGGGFSGGGSRGGGGFSGGGGGGRR